MKKKKNKFEKNPFIIAWKKKLEEHKGTHYWDDMFKKMSRTELIFELAKYAHPSWYHQILDWPTEDLDNLLKYYNGEAEIVGQKVNFNKDMIAVVTLEFRKVGEPLKNKMQFHDIR
jgi:hypothetical protein